MHYLKRYGRLMIKITFFLTVFFSTPALAIPVAMSTGKEVDLTARQVELLKNQPGIYYFEHAPEKILGSRMRHWVSLRLPESLGGGFLIGMPENMTDGLVAVRATKTAKSKIISEEGGSSATLTNKGFNVERAISGGPKFDLMLDVEKWEGDTTYQIGGTVTTPTATYKYHFPISELEFPLDVYMVSIAGSVEFKKRFIVSTGLKTNITDDAGKMKDSDWGVPFENPPGSGSWWWYGPDSLDIYSESDAELDALIIDINLRYRFFEKSGWSFSAGFGYLYQNFDYETRLNRQWSPSGLSGYDYTGTGEVTLTYEVDYSILFAEIGAQFKIKDKLSIEASLGYSPFVYAKDEDHHLLRSMVSKGDCNGDAILFSLKGQYDFLKRWFLRLGFEYMKIETEGESDTYVYGVYDHTIDQEIFSDQSVIALDVGFIF